MYVDSIIFDIVYINVGILKKNWDWLESKNMWNKLII